MHHKSLKCKFCASNKTEARPRHRAAEEAEPRQRQAKQLPWVLYHWL